MLSRDPSHKVGLARVTCSGSLLTRGLGYIYIAFQLFVNLLRLRYVNLERWNSHLYHDPSLRSGQWGILAVFRGLEPLSWDISVRS